MSIINNLFKKKVGADLLKNKDFSAAKESGMNGRTMMEMLGTLAIIGVLSIGGIAGYSYAMDKYRANVTINDINGRAVDLITQAGRGIDLSLAEWGQTSTAGYTFDGLGEEGGIGADAGLIYLQISGLPERVCEMVAESLGEQFDLAVNGQHYSENNSTLCGDDNKIRVYFERNGAGVTCEPACGSGEICINGICVDDETSPATMGGGASCSTNAECPECWACYGNTCSNAYLLNGSSCDTNGTGTCQNGSCLLNNCSSDSDCGSNEFCKDSNSSCTSRTPNKCTSLNGYFVRKTITLSDNTTETWFISNAKHSWWDADAACRAAGLTMATVDDLVSGWSSPSTGYYTRTERAQKLSDAIVSSNDYVWTSDINPSNSCYAFYVGLSYGNVYSNDRNGGHGLALCH